MKELANVEFSERKKEHCMMQAVLQKCSCSPELEGTLQAIGASSPTKEPL